MAEKKETPKETPKDSKDEKGSAPAAKAQVEIKTVVSMMDINYEAGKYEMPVEVSVFLGNQALGSKQVEIRDGIKVIANGVTDNRGVVVLTVQGKLENKEVGKQFRVCLIGTPEETIISVTLPDKNKVSGDNDPDNLAIYRYHDKQGNFRILVRILKAKGAGVVAPFSTWFKGVRSDHQTDENGMFDFPISGVCKGDDEQLLVFVNGVEEKAKLRIHYPDKKPSYRDKENWLISTNNGRAIILAAMVIIFWIGIFFSIGIPAITPDSFRNKDTGLSAAEKFYNESAQIADKTAMIQRHEIAGSIPDKLLIFGIIFSILAVFYFILSWREEIFDGIESGFERIIDKNSDKVDDPVVERWMKYFGMMHKVGGPQIKVTSTGNPSDAAAPESGKGGGHPSLGTLFQLDLMSEVLVEIVPAVFKKVFGK